MSHTLFSTLSPSPAAHTMDGWLTLDDAASRAFGAAKLALRGDAWGYSLQVDCAADVLSDVIAETLRNPRRGSPADVLAWIDRCERFPTLARRFSDALPADRLSFSRLYGLASNWRRAEVARRERAGKARTMAETVAGMADQDRGACSPQAARAAAVDVLDRLGLARLGKLYPVAYAAAREADGLTGDEIAAELSMKRGTLVAQISRAATKVPSAAVMSPRAHLEELRVDEYRPAGKRNPNSLTPATGHDPRDWRGDRNPAPVIEGLTIRYEEPTADAWTGETAADWTKDIRPSTAARLAYAAKLQRNKSAARTPAERALNRAAAGLPGSPA